MCVRLEVRGHSTTSVPGIELRSSDLATSARTGSATPEAPRATFNWLLPPPSAPDPRRSPARPEPAGRGPAGEGGAPGGTPIARALRTRRGAPLSAGSRGSGKAKFPLRARRAAWRGGTGLLGPVGCAGNKSRARGEPAGAALSEPSPRRRGSAGRSASHAGAPGSPATTRPRRPGEAA